VTQVVGGQIFEGIFSSIDSKGIHLRMASLTHDSTGKLRATKPEPIKVIPTAEWLSIDATDVRMGSADVGPLRAGDDAGGFGTDAAISRGRGG